jgi:hypothetical protein
MRSTTIRNHLRSNVIGYVALFVALSGTAMASHPGGADTISAADIINNEIRTEDIRDANVTTADYRADSITTGKIADGEVGSADVLDGSLGAADLGVDSVGTAELVGGSVGTFEIGANEVLSRNIATAEVNGGDIASDAVSGADIANDAVGRLEIAQDAVGTVEIATDSVGGAEIVTDSVTSGELGSVFQREGLGLVEDPVAHDGIWTVGTDTVSCNSGEVMLSVTMNWTDAGIDVDHGEKAFSSAEIDPSGSIDTATVTAIFDGGGGSDDPATFSPVATCLAA